jgi:hypothetical protein
VLEHLGDELVREELIPVGVILDLLDNLIDGRRQPLPGLWREDVRCPLVFAHDGLLRRGSYKKHLSPHQRDKRVHYYN